MFSFNIGEEAIVQLKVIKRKDTGQEKMYYFEGWVLEDNIVPIQGLDEAIEEAQKEIVQENLPKNGHDTDES